MNHVMRGRRDLYLCVTSGLGRKESITTSVEVLVQSKNSFVRHVAKKRASFSFHGSRPPPTDSAFRFADGARRRSRSSRAAACRRSRSSQDAVGMRAGRSDAVVGRNSPTLGLISMCSHSVRETHDCFSHEVGVSGRNETIVDPRGKRVILEDLQMDDGMPIGNSNILSRHRISKLVMQTTEGFTKNRCVGAVAYNAEEDFLRNPGGKPRDLEKGEPFLRHCLLKSSK